MINLKTAALGIALTSVIMGRGEVQVAVAPQPKEVRETIREVRREVREEAREARQEARETREELRQEAKEVRRELKEERRGLLEELREKVASLPGILRSLLAKRATIVSGTVQAKADTTLTVEKDGTSYTVLTGSFDKCTTRFRRRFWGVSSIAEVNVGDTVNVFGFWQNEERTIVEACLVRDLSIQKRFGVFVGTVLSLTGSGWVMDPVGGKRPNQTVTVSAETKFVNRKNETITQADVKVGHRVRVKGLWNMITNTLTEVIHVKDYSLPPSVGLPTVTITVTPTP